ncbi:methyltransferase [Streptosporangium sp. NPDC020072]|uniref:methyltransferase n=1 Tax=Streptosporangium sp. NPDC020072 TaxID=3154788 RepID=UPI003429E2DB
MTTASGKKPTLPHRTRGAQLPQQTSPAGVSDLFSYANRRGVIQRILGADADFGVLLVIARFRIADLLAEGPRTVEDLAAQCGVDAAKLGRILRVAVKLKLLDHASQPDSFVLTEEGRQLCSDVPGSLLWAVLVTASQPWREAITSLPHVLQGGEPETTLYEQLDADPVLGQHFQRFMTARSYAAGQLLAQRDCSHVGTVIDIGGGHGTLLSALLRQHPHLSGVLLERPSVAIEARKHLADLGGRCEVVEGDFFTAVPAPGEGDGITVYVLGSVLHNWDDVHAIWILSTIRDAIRASGRQAQLWCVDMLIQPYLMAPTMADRLNVRMMANFPAGGQERTFGEYSDLMTAAGFQLVTREPLDGDTALMVAEALPAKS